MSRVVATSTQIDPLDLETIRETLAYMHGDLAGRPGLERAATGIKIALVEIEAEQRRRRQLPGAKVAIARFVPWRD